MNSHCQIDNLFLHAEIYLSEDKSFITSYAKIVIWL